METLRMTNNNNNNNNINNNNNNNNLEIRNTLKEQV